MSATIDAVRGMRDVLPDEVRSLAQVRGRLEPILNSYGYVPIDLPIVEHRSLYLRKLGEELVGKVYDFSYGGRELALRPELTASVLRAYVAHMQDQPLPLRLSYCGPVFRYERPQRTTYRQFTQMGVELVGGPSPRADAEVLALTCGGLDAIGIKGYEVRLAHIGLVRGILAHMGLTERIQGLLAWSLERMRERGVDAVREQIREAHEGETFDPALLEGLNDEQAAALLHRMLGALNVTITSGTRPPSAIVDRLIRKLRREDPQQKIEHALEVLGQLCQIRGVPAEVLPEVTHLLESCGVPTTALDELRAILKLLDAHEVDPGAIALDFGMGRGLHYYTGIIFEAYSAEGLQLCGGGRYDDLVSALGGRQGIPAVGCAYGLERLRDALRPALAASESAHTALVVAVEDDDYAYATDVARRLRANGFVASVDVRNRGVAASLREAARRGTRFVAIVGAAERAERLVVWRDLEQREESRVPIASFDKLQD